MQSLFFIPSGAPKRLTSHQPKFRSTALDPIEETPEIALAVAVAAICGDFAIRETMIREHREYLAAIKLDPAA